MAAAPAIRGDRNILRMLAVPGCPKDSVRDELPPEVTEPFLEAVHRLLRELAREANRPRR